MLEEIEEDIEVSLEVNGVVEAVEDQEVVEEEDIKTMKVMLTTNKISSMAQVANQIMKAMIAASKNHWQKESLNTLMPDMRKHENNSKELLQ